MQSKDVLFLSVMVILFAFAILIMFINHIENKAEIRALTYQLNTMTELLDACMGDSITSISLKRGSQRTIYIRLKDLGKIKGPLIDSAFLEMHINNGIDDEH